MIAVKFKGKDFNLALTTSAICALEDEVDQSINEILARFQNTDKLRMKEISSLFRVMMLKEKPDATFDDACALVDEMRGNHHAIMLSAVQAAFPDPVKGDQPEK
ncbi:GTA-gp10 family protein [Falsihalocynthiibacter sp. CO-5D18]|uniref:GTA-gp10 family protein n=1 Tax=Falsihalocynthiibacter sp. CO-5D18 TaxID=3240872 RepID=UPI0035101393